MEVLVFDESVSCPAACPPLLVKPDTKKTKAIHMSDENWPLSMLA
jgi:hypothetical protein